MSLHRRLLTSALLVLPAAAWAPAHAVEVYVPLGLPGVGIGIAQPMGPMFGLRADYMTLGNREKDVEESGINYRGQYKLNRGALLLDVFPFAGSFRLTVGVTANTYKIGLDASGAGGSLTIGDQTYNTTAADGLNVQVTFPKSTPYVGLGWGHHTGSGFRFSADIGAALGKARLTATPRGALANQADIQANIDKELVDVRDGVGKVTFIPQLSISLGYSF